MPLVKLKEFIKERAEENTLLEIEDVKPPCVTKEGLERYIEDKAGKGKRPNMFSQLS